MTAAQPEAVVQPAAGRLDSLTGMRFVAALLVFGCHTWGLLPHGAGRSALQPLLLQGRVGVSFFFVLSGFVLTWSHRTGSGARRFYRRRFARLAPAYWTAFVTALLLTTDWSGDRRRTVLDALPSVVGLQAWFPDRAVYYAANGVGWSLSAEAFFYLLFPLLIRAMRRRWTVIALAAVSLAVEFTTPALLRPRVEDHAFWVVYNLPVQRLAEFIGGMVLAHALRRGVRLPGNVVTAGLIAAVAYLVAGSSPLWAQVSLVTYLPTLYLIGVLAQRDGSGHRPGLLGRALPVRLGELSFSFYLFHQIVLRTLFHHVPAATPERLLLLVVTPAALAVSLLVAFVVNRCVERPLDGLLRGSGRPTADSAGIDEPVRVLPATGGAGTEPHPTALHGPGGRPSTTGTSGPDLRRSGDDHGRGRRRRAGARPRRVLRDPVP